MTNEIVNKFTVDEVKKKALEFFALPADANQIANELGPDLTKYINGDEKDRKETEMSVRTKASDLLHALSLDSHFALMESVDEKYRGFAKELSVQLVDEYKCTTSLEKALIEVIAGSFIRIIDNSRRLNNELGASSITPNRNIYIANLSKQLDRSNRQFQSAISTLKQLKAPSIELNIKTKNTFISQNQQINVEKPNEAE